MRHLIRLVLLALVATLTVVVVRPAEAAVVLDDYTVLPAPSVSQLLPVPQSDRLAIASWEAEVAIVDRATGAVTTVPGTSGTGRLTADITGERLYGVTRRGGSITEIDLRSMTARSWPVAGCPIDAVARQGVIFYIESGSCDQWSHLMKLDPATGATTVVDFLDGHETERQSSTASPVYQPSLVSIPGQDTFVVVEKGSSGILSWIVGVGSDGSTSVLASRQTGGKAFMTDEGDAVVIGSRLYSLPDLAVLDDEIGIREATQVSSTLMTSVDSWMSRAAVHRRSDAAMVNRFMNPVETEQDPSFTDARVDDGKLYLIANADNGTARLYVHDNATIPAPEVTITRTTPDPLRRGDPITFTGTVTQQGVPVAGAQVQLALRYPEPRGLATITTDDTGAWSYDFVPETADFYQIKASHTSEGRESLDVMSFDVAKTFSAITITGPESVEPRTPVTLQGLLHAGERGLDGRTVTWQTYCATTGYPVDRNSTDVITAADGTFSMTHTPAADEACAEYDFWVVWSGDTMYADAHTSHLVPVSWRRSDLTLTLPASAYVQDEVAGTMTLTVEGNPAPGEAVQVSLRHPDGTTTSHDGVTDADGRLSTSFMLEATGKYTVTAKSATTTDTLGDTATSTVTVSQVPSHLTVEPTPASVKVGDPVTVRARLQREDGRNGDVKVQLIAHDEGPGRRDHFAATDTDGYVEFTDTPAAAGTTDYWVRYWGDGSPAVRYLPAQDQRFSVTASQVASSLIVDPAPSSIKVGDPVTIRARLQREDGRNGDVEVQLIAIDEAGARRDHLATTDAGGYVEFTDTPATAGTTDYTVRYGGDGSPAVRYLPAPDQRFPVTVDAHTPLLELRTDRARYDAGQNATIDVDVTGSETRHVVVTAKPADGDPLVIFDGAVPAGGLELTRTMRYSETIEVRHPADARHEARVASLWRGVRLGLKTTASRPADRIGNYAVYQRSADPTFVTSTSPRRLEVCVRMQLQKYADSAWRHVRTSVCTTTGSLGKSRWTLTGRQATGVKFRTRSIFAGDPLNTASRSSWTYFRFR